MGKIFVLSSKDDVDAMKATLKDWESACPTFQVLYCNDEGTAVGDLSDYVAIWIDLPARGLAFSFDLLCLLADHCPVFLNALDANGSPLNLPVQMMVGLSKLTYSPLLARIVNRVCLVSYEHTLVPTTSEHTYVETERAVYTIAYTFLSKLYLTCHESSRAFLLRNHLTPDRRCLGIKQINIFHTTAPNNDALHRMRMLNGLLNPGEVFQMSKDASAAALQSERGFQVWKKAVEGAPAFSQVVFQLNDEKLGQVDPSTLLRWLDLKGRQRITIFVENKRKQGISTVNAFFTRPLSEVESRIVRYTEDGAEFVLALGAVCAQTKGFWEFSRKLRDPRNEDLANILLKHAVRMLRKA